MKPLKILALFLLVFFSVSMVRAQSSYVIHNDLNNTKWTNSTITTAIHNETLSAYHCNSTGVIKIYDDFTTWIEHDGVNRLSETIPRVTFSNLQRTDLVWLYDNKAGELQNFVIEFRMKMTSINSASSTVRFDPIMISSVLDTYNGNRGSQSTQFGIQLRSWSSSTGFNLLPIETYGPSTYYTGATSNVLTKNILYYVRLTKSGTSLNLKVDNDEDFSSPITSYTLTLHANHNLNYMMMPQSAELNTPCPSYGYMECLWFGETAGGYGSGYLFTEDLLTNYTDGSPFSLIYNASIPSGQGFNVSVSQDGESWNMTEEEGPQTNYLVSYLEPFNWTSLYVRFGFETDQSDTPILYDYHLTFYRDAEGDGGISLEFGDLYWILVIIWLGLLSLGQKNNAVKVLGSVFGMVMGIYFLSEDTLIGFMLTLFNLVIFILAVRESR